MKRGPLVKPRQLAVCVCVAAILVGAACRNGSGPFFPVQPQPTPHAWLGRQADCQPGFPDEDGWLGGDAAASVVLPGTKGRESLWLFGDSFVERPGSPPGERVYPFVHNSVAVSRCGADGHWQLDYTWRSDAQGAPRAFFEPEPGGDAAYYWPISAAAVGDVVFVALLRVAPAEASGPFKLPFRLEGVDLARIEGLSGPPTRWQVRYSTLSRGGEALPAASLVAQGDHLYAFAFLDREGDRSPRILTRLPLAALAQWRPKLEDALETLADDGRFITGLNPERAPILMDDDASEMSVHFDPGLGRWLAVYSDPTASDDGDRGDTIWLRRAEDLRGPWSAPEPLLRIPELANLPDPEPGEPFCYAGKAHPELAPSGELLVTWVCNLYAPDDREIPEVLERLRTTPTLYRPRTLRIPIP